MSYKYQRDISSISTKRKEAGKGVSINTEVSFDFFDVLNCVTVITLTCLKYNINTQLLNNQSYNHHYHVVGLVVGHKQVAVEAVVDNTEVVVVVDSTVVGFDNIEAVVVVGSIAVVAVVVVVEDSLDFDTGRFGLEVGHLDVGTT